MSGWSYTGQITGMVGGQWGCMTPGAIKDE